MKFAVIETGGKQYKVSEGQKLKIERIKAEKDANFVFDKVLLANDGEEVKIGLPHLAGTTVQAKVLEQGRDKKKIIFKYRSKTRYRKMKGHRQRFTEVEIGEIHF